MKKIHIIYLPGLGDKYDTMRRAALRWWRFKDVSVELVPMRWESNEPLSEKYRRIEECIDACGDAHVVLMGESAGGSVAVALYERLGDRVARAVSVCGKNQNANNVSPKLYRKNPAFYDAMKEADISVKRIDMTKANCFLSAHPRYDPVVAVQETLLPGCQEFLLGTVGHLVPITEALTISSRRLVKAIRRTL